MDFDAIRAQRPSWPELLTLAMLAVLFGVSLSTVRHWRVARGLPTRRRPGDRKVYCHRDDLADWLERQRELTESGMTIRQITALTGYSAEVWRDLVRDGDAPQAGGRDFVTNELKWFAHEVHEFHHTARGGVSVSGTPRRCSPLDAASAGKP